MTLISNIKAVYKVLAGNLERIFVHPSLMQTALAEATSNKRTDTSSILRVFKYFHMQYRYGSI